MHSGCGVLCLNPNLQDLCGIVDGCFYAMCAILYMYISVCVCVSVCLQFVSICIVLHDASGDIPTKFLTSARIDYRC